MATPQHVQQQLWQQAGQNDASRLYVIVDGARDGRIYPNVLLCGLRHECLYRGDLPDVLAAAAPHLVELRKGVAFTDWLFRYGWGNSWGIFLTTEAEINELRKHFRRFLKVRDEKGKRLFFRYYDPRVLRAYLPTCNEEELDYVFGPVDQYLVESEQADTFLAFRNDEFRLVRNIFPIATT